MKINKIFLPVMASAMLLTACDDQIMEWGRPAGQQPVTTADALRAAVAALTVGEKATFTWTGRDGTSHTGTGVVAEGPPQ